MAITHLFAGIPARDYPSLLGWYERLLGRPPDMTPHDEEAVWQLTETGLVYVVADPDAAGGTLVTLIVDDLDRRLAELAERGISPRSVETLAGAGRKAEIADPEGNRIAFAQLQDGEEPG